MNELLAVTRGMRFGVGLGHCVLALVAWTCTTATPARAAVRLPSVFSDNMVLQREMPAAVWGSAAAGEKVSVEFASQKKTAEADVHGKWLVRLDPMPGSAQPRDLIVRGATGTSQITIHNVLVGEVWLCAGQSNMEKPIGIHPGQKPCPNYEQEIASADYPEIRLAEIPPKRANAPAADVQCQWLVCNPANICKKRGGGHGYSAAAYFFGRELHRELKTPIGLIAASASGTRCEPWTPDEGSMSPNVKPVLYNAMIYPIVPMAIRGAIWYQGESNMGDGMLYCEKMKTLIRGWRKAWSQGDFPFYFVQISPAGYNRDPLVLPELWEAQAATLTLANTGMAVTIDVGSYPDCHATNKQAVGRRLALWALANTYGRKDLVCSGPLYKSMGVESDKIRLRFDHLGGGLASRDGAPLRCFEIAGADRKFVAATARIDGSALLVWSPAVTQPMAVRFAWRQDAKPNLMNKEGLPTPAFRTDNWPRNRE